MRKKWLLIGSAIALYVLTWLLGPAGHARELQEQAQRLWSEADASNRFMSEFGGGYYQLIPNGPHTKVNWCVPVLPGLMLANSEYHIARLYGAGGYKLVLFYGYGTVELGTVVGWIS